MEFATASYESYTVNGRIAVWKTAQATQFLHNGEVTVNSELDVGVQVPE